MKWGVAGGMGIPFAAAVFCMLPLFTSSTGDIRHHGTSRARGWRGGANTPADVTANNSVSNVTAQLGGTAYLHCLVGHLSERGQVSWIRKRDWHILSSGKFTYTNDERFQVLHGEGSEDWTLQIKFVQKRDNGTYECQVSTRTGMVSHYVRLQIVVPEAFILGSGEHHVDLGSVIHLICIVEKGGKVMLDSYQLKLHGIPTRRLMAEPREPEFLSSVKGAPGTLGAPYNSMTALSIHPYNDPMQGTGSLIQSPTPPQYVFWYHNDRMINYDATRGGITVETEPGARTQSRLTVRGATLKDSGNYTCSASNTEPASIHVFVSEGSNKMAAILRRNKSAIHGITSSITCLLLFSSVMVHFGLR